MAKSLEWLIDKAKDFDLINAVFQLIIDRHGDMVDVSTLPSEYRAVVLVWHSMGIIGNGGFNYLFELTFQGDPHFELTAQA